MPPNTSRCNARVLLLLVCHSRHAEGAAQARPRSVLVVGGSGRVGASTVNWLHKLSTREGLPVKLAIGGRSQASFDSASRRLKKAGVADLEFVVTDLEDASSLAAAVAGRDLIVHTAGPFQQRDDPALLRAALNAGVPYCDVCDEWELSRSSKAELDSLAKENKVPTVLSCGIWPGVSALMAAEAVGKLNGSCDKLEYSFFTSGTGGAGPTIVSATFLLLCTPVVTLKGGSVVEREPWTSRRVVDFGDGVGERECFLLDNPDVPSSAAALGVPEASSRFGTAPSYWNALFGGLKVALGPELLADRQKMQGLAIFSMPIIRAVDALVGATNAMRVDAHALGGEQVTLRVAHPDLEQCVGQATAAFGLELLRASHGLSPTVPPGVWYPAELGECARRTILARTREDAFIWEM